MESAAIEHVLRECDILQPKLDLDSPVVRMEKSRD